MSIVKRKALESLDVRDRARRRVAKDELRFRLRCHLFSRDVDPLDFLKLPAELKPKRGAGAHRFLAFMPVPSPLKPQIQGQSSSSEGHALSVHRCRFVDYNPAAITAIAFPPLALPGSSSKFKRRRSKKRFGNLAVGRANGNIELYEWAVAEHAQDHILQAPQAWVLVKVCAAFQVFNYFFMLKQG